MGQYRSRRDYDDYDDYGPPRRRPAPRPRYDGPPPRGGSASRRPPDRYRGQYARGGARSRRRDERRGVSPGLFYGLLANVAILLSIAVLYFGFPSTFNRLLHILTHTDPPLAKGADIVVLAHSVPWGTLSPDTGASATPQPTGSAQPTASPQPSPTAQATTTPQATATSQASGALQPAGTADGRPYYRLARGTHALIYAAAPWPPVRCTLSVPADSKDTCPLATIAPAEATRALGAAARAMNAEAIVDNLAADQQKALFDAVHAALASQPTNVQPFERYLNASGQVVYTYQTLQALLYYDVNTDPAHAVDIPAAPPTATGTPTATTTAAPTATSAPATTPSPGATATPAPPAKCVSLCEAPLPADAPTDAWNLLANLAPAWRYATNGGTVLAPRAPTVSSGAGATMTIVNIKWAGQWQVGAKDADKASLLAGAVGGMASGLKLPSGWEYRVFPAPNPADGYLVACGKATGDPNAPLATPTAQVLYRFGVFVTGNLTARTTFPAMPRGTTAENALAQAIATQVHM